MLVYQAARRQAENLLQAFDDDSDLDSLVALAQQLGASVDFVDDLPDGASGMVVQEKGDDPAIFINSMESKARQRFTLAHEIGHIIERQVYAEDDEYSFVDYRLSGTRNLHEFFANEFAGALLMPEPEFKRKLEEVGPVLTALHFGVSVPAVKERKRRLDAQS